MDKSDFKKEIVPGNFVYFAKYIPETDELEPAALFVLKVFENYVIVLQDESVKEYDKSLLCDDFDKVKKHIASWNVKES